MSQRDCGWIQLYAETNQEALDLHIQAFRLAEELSTPVMVCMDGFILTHAVERVEIPTQEQVDAFLPPFEPRQVLDPDEPITIGAMVGPEAFTEVKYLAHAKQMQALELIPEIAAEFSSAFGRDSGGLIRAYRSEDAETIVVALGSVLGTIKDIVDELRERGRERSASSGSHRSARSRSQALRAALGHAQRVVVLEKALAVGIGGIVSANVRMALAGIQLHGYTVIAGLGGRPITKRLAARAVRRRGGRPAGAADVPGPGLGGRQPGARAHGRLARAPARTPRTSCATSALSRRGRYEGHIAMSAPQVRFYQTGSFAVGNRLLDPEQRSVQADEQRTNSITCGHRACQGCGEALGARYALDAAMRAHRRAA